MSIQDIINMEAAHGVDDYEINYMDDGEVQIGYWSFAPVNVIHIKDNKITYIIYDRQPELDYLFDLYDNQSYIEYTSPKDIKGVVNIFRNKQ